VTWFKRSKDADNTNVARQHPSMWLGMSRGMSRGMNLNIGLALCATIGVLVTDIEAAVAYDNIWACNREGKDRFIHLKSTEPTGCELFYHKKSEGEKNRRLWWAETSRSFCSDKATKLHDQLQAAGWVCVDDERARIARMVSKFLQEDIKPDRVSFTRLQLNAELDSQYQIIVKDDAGCEGSDCSFKSNLFQIHNEGLELLMEGRLFFADGFKGAVIDSRPMPDASAVDGYADLVAKVLSKDEQRRYAVYQHKNGKYRLAQVLLPDDVLYQQLETLDW